MLQSIAHQRPGHPGGPLSLAADQVQANRLSFHPPVAKRGDTIQLRFAGYSTSQKKHLLKTAPVVFVDGADPKLLADKETQAVKIIREAALAALKEGELASDPKVKGPLAEGWGAAAIIDTPDQRTTLADSNINYRTDIKLCAEQNLLDRIIKHPAVRSAEKPQVKLLTNVLFNFDQPRYHNKHLTPCDTCLDTMQAVRLNHRPGLFSPETLIASVAVENDGGKERYLLEVRPFKALLPMMGKTQPSFPTQPIDGLPVEYSDAARKLMASRQHAKIQDEHVRNTMQQALTGFAESALTRKSERSGEYLGAGLMIYPDAPQGQPTFSHGSSLHIKNSEPAYPELDALGAMLASRPGTPEHEKLQATLQNPALLAEQTNPAVSNRLRDKKQLKPLAENLAMMGFVHRQNDQPRPKLLGLMRNAAGGKDFLVGLIQDNRIRVFSSSDLLPLQYKDSRKPMDLSALSSNRGIFSRFRTWISNLWQSIRNHLPSWLSFGKNRSDSR